jgi:hypothetical protein
MARMHLEPLPLGTKPLLTDAAALPPDDLLDMG